MESQLIDAHMAEVPKLAGWLAHRMPRGMTREELACAGYLGLVQGAARADLERPDVAAYLRAKIAGAMRHEIRGVTGRRGRAKVDRTQSTAAHLARADGLWRAPSDPPWVLRDALRRAIARRLNRREASVLTQQYLEDRPVAEIAAFLGSTENYIGQVSFYARAKLRADRELRAAYHCV